MPAPRATLDRVIDALGVTLLQVLAGEVSAQEVSGVLIHDPLEPSTPTPGVVVLAVGLADPAAAAALLRQPGVAGVIVRMPMVVDEDVRRVADEAGSVLLGLTRGATWAQVAALLRSLLAVDDVGGARSASGGAEDLFSVASAVAALISAPVTIEDRSSRVVAFSADQPDEDAGRVATILGRQVPEHFRRMLEERGVFRQLYAADEPVYVEALPGTELPRVAVRVRAGDEILGSIWAAVAGQLTAERTQALLDAARVVALHMLRERAGVDAGRRMRSELVATVLEGGSGAGEAASRLGITSTKLCVLALAPRADPAHADAAAEADLQRAAAAFAMHLAAVHPKSAVASIGDVVYGLLPMTDESTSRAEALAGEFSARLGDRGVVIGIGRVVTDRTALSRSRHDADRAVRVLRRRADDVVVATAADVQAEALLLDLVDLVERDASAITGPVARLLAYDASKRGDLVDTLRRWLDAFGDVNEAAAAMHVHPNTFRYRLRRLAEVGQIDLGDPDARFSAMLQLRLIDLQRVDQRDR